MDNSLINCSNLFGTSFNEIINLNRSSQLLMNDMIDPNQTLGLLNVGYSKNDDYQPSNTCLESFKTSIIKRSNVNRNIQMIAKNISPEKISSESDSNTDSEAESQPDNVNANKRKRKLKFEFIENSKVRASAKYKRKNGIYKKMKWFDRLTNSQSAFLSFSNKNKLTAYAEEGSRFKTLLPSIEKLIQKKSNGKQTKSVFTNCNLESEENKHISDTHQRIINSKSSDKIIYASRAMSSSKSYDYEIEDSNSISVKDDKFYNAAKENLNPKKSCKKNKK